MKTISVCMIVKNEEDVIDRILKQVVQFADEVIIVDTGSTDKTKLRAKKYTNNIFDFAWQNDFSIARNFSFSKATCDYIMWLDADDYITNLSINKLKELKAKLNNDDTIYLPYKVAFTKSGKCTFKYLRERIVKNNGKFKWAGKVHEVLNPYGVCATYNIPIKHKKIKCNESERNLNIYRQMIKQNEKLNTRELFYYANELYYNNYFDEACFYYTKFLEQNDKFAENAIQAKINLSKIYKSKDEIELAKKSLYESFLYDLPRSEALCELGHIYFESGNYKSAIYYYKLAIQKPNINTFAFIDINSYCFIPNLQIALCYYNLKDYKNAIKYNMLAIKVNPKDEIALINQKFYIEAQKKDKS